MKSITESVVRSRILNDTRKNTTKRTANYFFIVTIAIVLINMIVFATCGRDTGDISVRPNWGALFGKQSDADGSEYVYAY